MQTYRIGSAKSGRGHMAIGLLIGVVVVIGLLTGFKVYQDHSVAKTTISTKIPTPGQTTPAKTLSSADAAAKAATTVNQCSNNTLDHLIVVSIGQRHLWACNTTSVAYDSAVITGMQNLAADLTPTGTYHIYAKYTDTTLTGHDSTGSWNDPVSYWMPFLDNQYGVYGFHDATWRPADAFGNVSPYSTNASHGCVETPLATAKWLYNWAAIGTTVTIKS